MFAIEDAFEKAELSKDSVSPVESESQVVIDDDSDDDGDGAFMADSCYGCPSYDPIYDDCEDGRCWRK